MMKSVLLVLIVLTICLCACSEKGDPIDPIAQEEAAMTELHNVQLAVAAIMYVPDPPIENLSTDYRISGYVSDKSHPTNIMTNGGLLTIIDDYIWNGTVSFEQGILGDLVSPPSSYLSHNRVIPYDIAYEHSNFFYTVTATGTVTGYYDENGEQQIPSPY